MKKYALSELVLDFDLYPRGDVDSHHVTEIASALEAGAAMPPIVIDKKSKRIADGFHRWKAMKRLYGEEHQTQCIEKNYVDDRELFLDAMRYNSSHGRALTQHDKGRCLTLASNLGLEHKTVCDVLNLSEARAAQLVPGRVAMMGTGRVQLKQTIKHMAGQELTKDQAEANNKLSGMNQLFYVNQIITLIENDLVDTENSDLLAGMQKLAGLLEQILRKEAA